VKILDFLKNKWVQLTLAFIIGGTIGVIFYPSKTTEYREKIHVLEKKITTQESELDEKRTKISQVLEDKKVNENIFKDFKEDTSTKIESLRTENSSLKRSAKRKKFKLVKPDGTIIEKEYEESSSEETTSVITEVREEFRRKVESIESKWKQIHKTRVSEIKDSYEKKLKEKKTETIIVEKIVEKEKIVRVNEKKVRLDAGATTDKKIYMHLTYPLWGPFFIAGGAAVNPDDGSSPSGRLGIGMSF